MTDEIVIKTTGLSKRYGSSFYAVQNVNVEIKRGEIYGIIGENGAGKTTFIRLLMGLVLPTAGTVEIFGKSDAASLSAARKRIGSIVEAPALYPSMNAYKNLENHAILLGIPKAERKVRIEQVLEDVKLTDTGKKKAKNFSLGMKQRLALAVALLSKPEILILDEPINGLDPKGIIENREMLTKFAAEQNITILISSHILAELALFATRFCIISGGTVVRTVTAEELANDVELGAERRAASRLEKYFLNSTSM
ncbi:MAG: hypothetical protein Ta2A_07150 [Treponemataceae bacterium]|nr:MAG: hypothetical protein Ta2A_07150 [Treponemataceae bacterium]